MTFYDRYVAVCRRFGIAPTTAAECAGLNRSAVTRWKQQPDSMPTGRAIEQLTTYFGITANELLSGVLGDETPDTGLPDERFIQDLFGTTRGVTPELYRLVQDYAAFMLARQWKLEAEERKSAL